MAMICVGGNSWDRQGILQGNGPYKADNVVGFTESARSWTSSETSCFHCLSMFWKRARCAAANRTRRSESAAPRERLEGTLL